MNKMDKKTVKIGQACAQFYKNKNTSRYKDSINA